jgi:exopolysaccharide biosynthesis protein
MADIDRIFNPLSKKGLDAVRSIEAITSDNGIPTFSQYSTNAIDEASATVTYIGKEDKDGNWYVLKIDTSSGTVFTYATITNNPTQTTGYADAWADRATLTYDIFSVAF